MFQLEDDSGVTAQWIVKTPSMYKGMSIPLLREVAAADIYAIAGLPPPQCGLLRLPEKAIRTDDTAAGRYAAELFTRDAGRLAFCSSYVEAPVVQRSVFVHRGRMKETILADAIALYCLDLFLWNGDRTRDNPNCLRSGGHLVPIDHDRVFFGLEKIDEAGCGPDLGQGLPLDSVTAHVAHALVQKHPRNPAWQRLQASLTAVAAELPTLQSRWPAEWDRDPTGHYPFGFADEITRFLRARVPRVVEFLNGLRR